MRHLQQQRQVQWGSYGEVLAAALAVRVRRQAGKQARFLAALVWEHGKIPFHQRQV